MRDAQPCPFGLEGFKPKEKRNRERLEMLESKCPHIILYYGDGLCDACGRGDEECPYRHLLTEEEVKEEKNLYNTVFEYLVKQFGINIDKLKNEGCN